MVYKAGNKIPVLLADDHPLAIEGVRAILEKAPDVEIIGEAKDGEELIELLKILHPRVLLLDMIMPNFSPYEFEEWARITYPGMVTLVLTGHDRDAYLARMMEAGAAGYLDKKLRAGQLLNSIRKAARGEFLYTKPQLDRIKHWREEVAQKWESLSEREREVLQMLTEGLENKAIAIKLDISINTVEKHLANIYQKLGAASRTEAVIWWLDKGTDFHN